jgi:hypothetical protein
LAHATQVNADDHASAAASLQADDGPRKHAAPGTKPAFGAVALLPDSLLACPQKVVAKGGGAIL